MTDTTRRMLGFMMYDMENRGKDSWGATNGDVITKRLGPVTETWFDHEEEIWSWDRAILHTRGASVGAVTIPNAHPFKFERHVDGAWVRTIVGIHNGHVGNHEELDKKYPDRRDAFGHKLEVDSAHIFAAFAEGAPTNEIHGWGNLAWYEYTPLRNDGVLHLMKFNADALNVVALETGEIVFCSELNSIRRAAHMAGTKIKSPYKIDDERMYFVDPEFDAAGVWVRDRLFEVKEKRVFGFRNAPVQQGWDGAYESYPTASYRPYRQDKVNIHTIQSEARSANVCGVVGCEKKVKKSRKNYLICDDCYDVVYQMTFRVVQWEHTSV